MLELAFGTQGFPSAIESPTGNERERAIQPRVAPTLAGIVAGQACLHIHCVSHIKRPIRTARYVDEVSFSLIFGLHRSPDQVALVTSTTRSEVFRWQKLRLYLAFSCWPFLRFLALPDGLVERAMPLY